MSNFNDQSIPSINYRTDPTSFRITLCLDWLDSRCQQLWTGDTVNHLVLGGGVVDQLLGDPGSFHKHVLVTFGSGRRAVESSSLIKI